MALSEHHIPIDGSEQAPLPGAREVGALDPNERIDAAVIVRRRTSSPSLTSVVEQIASQPPGQRRYLSLDELEARHGAHPDDVEGVHAFARNHSLDVVDAPAGGRLVRLAGTAASFNAAFKVDLLSYEFPGGTYIGYEGPLSIPTQLAPVVEAALGLDSRPAFEMPLREWQPATDLQRAPTNNSFTPDEVARLYNFPSGVDGTGQIIGLIEFGGGYRTPDLMKFFGDLHLPIPDVTPVSVDFTTQNAPDDSVFSQEVTLDIEVAGAVAPGAQIVVYFAANTAFGWQLALPYAVHDRRFRPSIISLSWSKPESLITPLERIYIDAALMDAAAMGLTVCCNSGDFGSRGLPPAGADGQLHVAYPASHPFALACGGAELTAVGGHIASEVVWNDSQLKIASGGGVSTLFDLPSWQVGAGVPPGVYGESMRGVPDVAGHAGLYQLVFKGRHVVFPGGTSAVAPLWAGLVALLNQSIGQQVGLLNPFLYQLLPTAGVFRDITSGNNDVTEAHPPGPFSAGVGWDACTGLGSPNGKELLAQLDFQVQIRTERDECGVGGAVPGGTARFYAVITGDLSVAVPTYSWSVSPPAIPLGSTSSWAFSAQLGPSFVPVVVSVVVTVDTVMRIATTTYLPDTAETVRLKELLCLIKSQLLVNYFVNPLWDPLRDYVVHPYTRDELVHMREVSGRLVSLATQALGLETELPTR